MQPFQDGRTNSPSGCRTGQTLSVAKNRVTLEGAKEQTRYYEVGFE